MTCHLQISRPTARRLRISMGTLLAIEASCYSQSAAEAAVDEAFAAAAAVDRRIHPRGPESDLGRINRAPVRARVTVHHSTWELLSLASRLNELTRGIFDPCLPSQPGRLRDVEIVDTAGAGGGLGYHVVCHAPVALDFGGFAKGYAVDRAIDALIAHGCCAGLVNAGGDLRLFGSQQNPILVRRTDNRCEMLQLTDAALAVSDADSRERPVEHQGYYNRDGLRSPRQRFVAVVAGQAVLADALAKCVMLCPEATAERVLREFDATSVA